MDVTIEHPEGPPGLVCDELEQKEGMKPGSRKLLLVIVALVRVRVRVRCRTRCAHRRTGFLPGAAEKAKKC